jgi:hypothetical protein
MPYYPGRFWQICDLCGMQGYNTEMVKTWDNLIVHKSTCFDGPRNPQDYKVRPKRDKQTVREPRSGGSVEPTVLKTNSATSIASTTATSGGNVTNNGGSSVTAYGVCWSTDTAPTTDDSSTSDGTGTGTYTSSLTGLTASTKYYLRAYATNAIGTAYGPHKEFTTTA